MACSVCGKVQAGRCEGGWITYLSCYTPCPKHPDRATLEPRPRPEWNPARPGTAVAATPGDDLWTVQPEPSAAGLEDLL